MSRYNINWVDDCRASEDAAIIQTPVGNYGLYSRGSVLLKTEWVDSETLLKMAQTQYLSDIVRQIEEYWQSGRTSFDARLLNQGTDFRNRVWRQLLTIDYGETITYACLAKALHTGARAVGSACRDNPFPIIVPCHRVVAVSGIGGYAGQMQGHMLDIKQKLLLHEQR